jgi:hypothetical protein
LLCSENTLGILRRRSHDSTTAFKFCFDLHTRSAMCMKQFPNLQIRNLWDPSITQLTGNNQNLSHFLLHRWPIQQTSGHLLPTSHGLFQFQYTPFGAVAAAAGLPSPVLLSSRRHVNLLPTLPTVSPPRPNSPPPPVRPPSGPSLSLSALHPL